MDIPCENSQRKLLCATSLLHKFTSNARVDNVLNNTYFFFPSFPMGWRWRNPELPILK
jgi:hypothetical protein